MKKLIILPDDLVRRIDEWIAALPDTSGIRRRTGRSGAIRALLVAGLLAEAEARQAETRETMEPPEIAVVPCEGRRSE
jgi:hypothetical protein